MNSEPVTHQPKEVEEEHAFAVRMGYLLARQDRAPMDVIRTQKIWVDNAPTL